MTTKTVATNADACLSLSHQKRQQNTDNLVDEFLTKIGSPLPSPENEMSGDQRHTPNLDDAAARPTSPVRVDLIAAAILTANAFSQHLDLLGEIDKTSPVVTITTPNSEMTRLVGDVMEMCVFGPETNIYNSYPFCENDAKRNALLIVSPNGEAKRNDNGNHSVTRAIQARFPVVGVADDPNRLLPSNLLHASDHNLHIKPLDGHSINKTIESVTGKRSCFEFDTKSIRSITITDLVLSIQPDRTPQECVERLHTVIRRRMRALAAGPTLESLPGYGAAKTWGLNLASDLQQFKDGELSWSEIDRGIILDGPPGVGKTQFAKALARSADVPLIATSVAEWNAAGHLSDTLKAIRNSFTIARQRAPSILFIDELDGISDRSRLQGDHVEYWSQVVNQLLELLDGVTKNSGTVVIGATNYANRIDPAIVRSGRLERVLRIEKPDISELQGIFRFYLQETLSSPDIAHLAAAALGATGADVEAWVRRAKSKVRRHGTTLKKVDVLDEVFEDSRSLPQDLIKKIAIHECGHIIVGHLLGCYETMNVTINPRGGSVSADIDCVKMQSLRSQECLITTLLAGRAAERVLLEADEVTVGAGSGSNSDLAKATALALDLEVRFGLGSNGLLNLAGSAQSILIQDRNVRDGVTRRLEDCCRRAERIISDNRSIALAMSQRLATEMFLDHNSVLQIFEVDPPALQPTSNEDSRKIA